jgi:hypothetical protein
MWRLDLNQELNTRFELCAFWLESILSDNNILVFIRYLPNGLEELPLGSRKIAADAATR